MARWADTLFGMATDTEFMCFGLVDSELPWRAFMAFSAWIKPHMLRVIEIYITIVSLENLCLSGRQEYSCYKN